MAENTKQSSVGGPFDPRLCSLVHKIILFVWNGQTASNVTRNHKGVVSHFVQRMSGKLPYFFGKLYTSERRSGSGVNGVTGAVER